MFHGFLHALFHRRDVLPGYRAAEDLVFEHEPGARGQRFHPDDHIAVLSMAACLFLVLALHFSRTPDGLPIFHHGRFQHRIHAEFPFHPFHKDFQMLVPHAADQGFLRYRVPADDERGIFIHEFAQGRGNLVLVPLLLGRDGPTVHGQRVVDGCELHWRILVAQGIAGHGELQTGDDADIPCHDGFHGDLVLAPQGADVAHFFHFIPARVVHSAVRLDDAGEHPYEAHPAHEGIGRSLEHHSRHRGVGVTPHGFTVLQILYVVFVQDGRERVVHNGGQGPTQADVLEGTAAQHREDDALPDALD